MKERTEKKREKREKEHEEFTLSSLKERNISYKKDQTDIQKNEEPEERRE